MAQTDRTTGLVGEAAMKVPCRAATAAAIVLSGEQTVDGVGLVTGDRCLVKNQASSIANGIYVVDTGAWTRAKDCDGPYDVVHGTLVHVTSGAVNAETWYELTAADPITIGTTSLTWALTFLGDSSTVAFRQSASGSSIVPTARTLEQEARETISPYQFGGVGDGVTNDSTAVFEASKAAVAQGKDVDFGGHTWLLGAQIALTNAHNGLRWRLRGATIKKGFNGNMVTLAGTANFSVDGQGTINGQSQTYNGKGFVFSGIGSTNPLFGPGIVFTSFAGAHIEFGADAGRYAKMYCDFNPDAVQVDYLATNCTGPDTVATYRKVIGSTATAGYHAVIGTQDAEFVGSAFKRVEISASCLITRVNGCTWGNGGTAMTISGTTTFILGCRFSGAVTLDANFSGEWIGNEFTAGSLTNNTVGLGAVIFHKEGGSSEIIISRTTLPAADTTSHRIQTSRVQDCGDQDQLYAVGGAGPTMRYNNILGADRTVTLSTVLAKNGDRVRIIRTAAATGAFKVIVTGIATLRAPGQECEAEYNGAAWVLAEFGIHKEVMEGSAVYDPANLADGAGATTTVAVTGAVLGDFAQASFSLDLQGITLTAYVSAADTVSVRFQNESGGVLDLASGTLRARVTRA